MLSPDPTRPAAAAIAIAVAFAALCPAQEEAAPLAAAPAAPAEQEPAPARWQFGDPVTLGAPDVKWSDVSVIGFPVHAVREGVPMFRWDPSAGLVGGFVPDVSRKTILDSPEQVADLGSLSEPLSFWDAVIFWHLPTTPAGGEVVERFFCTVYYTPKESGFTAEGGFDMTPVTFSGLEGRTFPRSFLRAVRVEGFGRIKEPHRGMNYIKYVGRNRYGYADRSLGNRNNTLVPRRSAAVHRRNPLFQKGTGLTILDPEVFDALGTLDWRAADTGGGLHMWQIDVYWDEDDPLGPGIDIYRPKHCPLAVSRWIPVAVEKH